MGGVTEVVRIPGRAFLHFISYMGQIAFLVRDLMTAFANRVWRLNLVAHQIVSIGYGSQAVVIVTGAFTGAVFTFQTYAKFKDFGVESSVGAIVSVALCREVGAAMAADIGTMKVTEQVDALRVMGVHPVDYLVLPRFIAMMISMPMLVAESISFGLMASYAVAVYGYGIPAPWFLSHMIDHTNEWDIVIGMIKGFVFGIIITLVACHQGLRAENGAVGVGIGTTRAVVISSLVMLIANFFLSILLNYIWPLGNNV
jgi:phospholipid/cholesterol/gamma-HCH transport system permease protein